MKPIALLACLLVLGFSSAGGASELVLDKLRLEYNISMGDSACDELTHIQAGKDVPNLATTPCYLRTGRYTFTLDAPAGTAVTLFAAASFGRERGYLTVVKQDDRPLWVLHLEDFPAGEWVDRPATKHSGAYRAFYRPGPAFRERVTSIQWGQWWTGDIPGAP